MDAWLLYVALAAGLYMAWNIGANDVANAFGTSVGSGAVTFRRAIVLAAIFEFAGAFLVGAHVSDTIKGNIIRPELFVDQPLIYAKVMLAALLAASFWLHLATYFGQPVSTTHAIIGAIIGAGIVAGDASDVQWQKMGRIAASWIVSPVCGALLSFVIYYMIRKRVLRSDQPVVSARRAVPVGMAAVVAVMVFSVCKDALPRVLAGRPIAEHWPVVAVPISLVLALVAGVITRVVVHRASVEGLNSKELEYGRIEAWFGRLQIATACYMAFAHGANDVANAIGPIAGVLEALKGHVGGKAPVPAWVLFFGGAGIVAGLATYGYKVIEAVGRKITEVTPTRGFSAEFGTATTVLVCSLLGLPISTTFVLVGSVMGVGFARGFGAIDLRVVRRIFLSWVITIPCSAAIAALLFGMLKTWH
ncbi:MAG: inorganic phosphate transporter [Lentisphaerae bacterium]|nr:inorganic phosphate transporter [Lentisphaerota bacterium]